MRRDPGKKLVLNRETVRELTDSQLSRVAGVGQTHGNTCGCNPVSVIGPDTVPHPCGGTAHYTTSAPYLCELTCGPCCS